jgi:hypothetical protein
MKKISFILLLSLLSLQKILACSSCNVEFSAEEKNAFIIATALLILIPFVGGWFLFKFFKKKYQ